MATYIPNALDKTQPTEDKFVESAALEFRTVKDPVIRSLRFPAADLEANRAELPIAADRAGKYLAFDPTTGQPYAAAAIGGATPVSAFGASLVGQLNASAARDVLDIAGSNRIINGNMTVAQRGTTFAAAASGSYTLDRWIYLHSSGAVATVSQQVDGPSPDLFRSLRIAVTTADAAIAAGDTVAIAQRIEGFNTNPIRGKTFTIGFWVRSSKVGVHCVALRNAGLDRAYITEYTVAVANTWEFKSISVPGGLITAGTWGNELTTGVEVAWVLACGTTFQTAKEVWQTGNFLATANQVNCMDTVGNIFALSGVRVVLGESAEEVEYRQHAQEVLLCMRYYQSNRAANYYLAGSGFPAMYLPQRLPVPMRVVPTITLPSSTNIAYNTSGGSVTPSLHSATMGPITPAGAIDYHIRMDSTAPNITGWSDHGPYVFNAEL